MSINQLDKAKVSGRQAYYSQEPDSRDPATGKFKPKYNEPLTRKAYGTRLPQSVGEKLDKLGDKKGEWMRQVLIKAAKDL